MRDIYKQQDFYLMQLDNDKKYRDNTILDIENERIKPERLDIVKGMISGTYWRDLLSNYSLGAPIDILKPLYLERLKWLSTVSKEYYILPLLVRGKVTGYYFANYDGILQEISLAILLGIDHSLLKKYIDIADEYGIVDDILEYLFRYIDPSRHGAKAETYVTGYSQAKYSDIRILVNDKFEYGEETAHLQRFIEGNFLHYNYKMKSNDYDSDPQKNGLMYYWCWLVGAIVYLEDLDDSIYLHEDLEYNSLREVPWYPKDMVDWARSREAQ